MGLLEDAIKEHLDLKRKHGAEDAEISKMEKEAFGPVEAPPPPAQGIGQGPGEPLEKASHAAVIVPEPQEPAGEAALPAGPAEGLEEVEELQPLAEDEGSTQADREEVPVEPEPPPTIPDDGGEDVLEETPEFLENTEDEQLWFEQKPPKDFDFND